MNWRGTARDWAPPVLLRAVRKVRRRSLRFGGRPRDWAEAQAASTGYDASLIVERVAASSREVLAGRGAYERDSVVFQEPAYQFPLLTALLGTALKNDGALTVVDFGGSLGSTYRQCRPLLDGVRPLHWHVVEQSLFVRAGQREFATDELHFDAALSDACDTRTPHLVLASSVLQYLKDPWQVLDDLEETGARTLVIDRMPLSLAPDDRLCIQHVSPDIYPASYPCWLLSRGKVLARLRRRWRLVCEYPALDGEWRTDDGQSFEFRGFTFERAA
ncbi:MAG: methyltransferase, TIGR04325 family [Caldimonas sp.]